ncbi:hypothetical protein DMX02_23575 [Pseudomonas jessenii]|nr:hypothetical protein DMX02_23575 [Pseudomonas jessenii]
MSLLAIASVQSTSPLPDPPPSRAGSLLHWLSVAPKILEQSRIPVGASLLAKASAQPASSLPDPPLSRASSLPQVFPSLHNPLPLPNPRHKKGDFRPLAVSSFKPQ